MSRKQNKNTKSEPRRLPLAVFVAALLVGAIAYNMSRSSARALSHIRELGQQDPAAAIALLEASGDGSRDGVLLRCQLLAASGRWEQAERVFGELVEPERCGEHELIELASLALGSGIYSLADTVLDVAYRQGNHSPHLLRTMIDVKYHLGADQEALRLCREMSALAPRDSHPWLRSAQIYQSGEKIDLAIGAYRESLLIDSDSPDAQRTRFQIADLAIYAGDLDAAQHELDRLSVELPDDPNANVLRAKLLHRKGDLDASLRLIDRVLATKPNMVSALLERGLLNLELGDLVSAVRDLGQVITLDPENYTGHYKLGLAYQTLNQPELARQHLQRSRQITERMSEQKLQRQRTTP